MRQRILQAVAILCISTAALCMWVVEIASDSNTVFISLPVVGNYGTHLTIYGPTPDLSLRIWLFNHALGTMSVVAAIDIPYTALQVALMLSILVLAVASHRARIDPAPRLLALRAAEWACPSFCPIVVHQCVWFT